MKAINYPSLQHAYCMLSICKGRFSSVTTCRNNPPGRCSVPKKPTKEQLRFGSTEVGKFGWGWSFRGIYPPWNSGLFWCLWRLFRCTVKTMFQIHHFKIHSPKLMVSLKKLAVSNRNLWKSKGDFQGVMLVSGNTMTLIGCRPAVVWERNM